MSAHPRPPRPGAYSHTPTPLRIRRHAPGNLAGTAIVCLVVGLVVGLLVGTYVLGGAR